MKVREKLTLGWRGATVRVPDITFYEEPAAPAGVRVLVPATEISAPGPWAEQDPVDLCLDLWKRWMAGDSDRDLGAKTMRGLAGEDVRNLDLHEAQQVSDARIAEATNAMVDSLVRLHVWAIYRACGMATVWNFPNASLMDVAADARAELSIKLRKNIATGLLFR